MKLDDDRGSVQTTPAFPAEPHKEPSLRNRRTQNLSELRRLMCCRYS